MAYTQPWQRVCDCRCLVNLHLPRTTYTEPDCACTITCATQPLTLLADPWGCALFLDHGGDLWHVPAMANGTWDWASAAEIGSRHDLYDASRLLEHLLRQAAQVLHTPIT
ncbi:hypothetical protein GA0070609_3451 [Micromonospora echinaurantiaca]|uniref:Uncharacterized protein n=1 Tax=Micromonospora echinaurantiaca TaxID=47857 RepID=A0A1C5IKF5_9ACTN|nr:hypothetical protein [Micromonospora echinaurantiaca]SCG58479.1 hypothetical protein GA0070609_3451 [Micromonospora echinaurantiaca]